jgi:hypothetical protein
VSESRLISNEPARPSADGGNYWGAGTWNDSGPPKTIGAIAVRRQGKPAYRFSTAKVAVGKARTVAARCPRGTHVSGGGGHGGGTTADSYVQSSFPFGGRDAGDAPDDGWGVRVYNISSAPQAPMYAFAVCATERPRYIAASAVAMVPGTPSSFLISNAAACPVTVCVAAPRARAYPHTNPSGLLDRRLTGRYAGG